MKKIQLLLFMLFSLAVELALACEPSTAIKQYLDKEVSSLCSAHADGSRALFLFSTVKFDKWVWHRKQTSNNALEYAWNIHFCDKSKLTFGVYVYKFPGSQEKSGTLKQLVNNAQFTVQGSDKVKEEIHYRVKKDLVIRAGVINGSVSVGVFDGNTYRVLFSKKPELAYMTMSGPHLEKPVYCKVKIQYENKNPDRLTDQDAK